MAFSTKCPNDGRISEVIMPSNMKKHDSPSSGHISSDWKETGVGHPANLDSQGLVFSYD